MDNVAEKDLSLTCNARQLSSGMIVISKLSRLSSNELANDSFSAGDDRGDIMHLSESVSSLSVSDSSTTLKRTVDCEVEDVVPRKVQKTPVCFVKKKFQIV